MAFPPDAEQYLEGSILVSSLQAEYYIWFIDQHRGVWCAPLKDTLTHIWRGVFCCGWARSALQELPNGSSCHQTQMPLGTYIFVPHISLPFQEIIAPD